MRIPLHRSHPRSGSEQPTSVKIHGLLASCVLIACGQSYGAGSPPANDRYRLAEYALGMRYAGYKEGEGAHVALGAYLRIEPSGTEYSILTIDDSIRSVAEKCKGEYREDFETQPAFKAILENNIEQYGQQFELKSMEAKLIGKTLKKKIWIWKKPTAQIQLVASMRSQDIEPFRRGCIALAKEKKKSDDPSDKMSAENIEKRCLIAAEEECRPKVVLHKRIWANMNGEKILDGMASCIVNERDCAIGSEPMGFQNPDRNTWIFSDPEAPDSWYQITATEKFVWAENRLIAGKQISYQRTGVSCDRGHGTKYASLGVEVSQDSLLASPPLVKSMTDLVPAYQASIRESDIMKKSPNQMHFEGDVYRSFEPELTSKELVVSRKPRY